MEASGKRRRGVTASASSSGGVDHHKFQNFPYYLSEMTKHELIASYFRHMKNKTANNKPKVPNTQHRVLLSGPEGSEIYQETLVRSLTHYFGAKLLVLDCQSNVRDMASLGLFSPMYALKYELKQLTRGMIMPSSVSTPQKAKMLMPKLGDKVVYTGLKDINMPNMASSAPAFGSRGVVLSLDQKTKKVGVRFNTPIPQGLNLGGLCEAKQGYICDVNELCIDVDDQVNPLFAPFQGFNLEGRTIVFMKHAVNFMAQYCHTGKWNGIQPLHLVNRIPDNIFLIGSHIQKELKVNFDGSGQNEQNFQRALVDFFDAFSDKISIQMPEDKRLFDVLKYQLDRDADLLESRDIISQLQQAVFQFSVACGVIEPSNVKDLHLTYENSVKMVRSALGREIIVCPPSNKNSKLLLSQESIAQRLDVLRSKQENLNKSGINPSPKVVVPPSHEYERRVLEDVILSSEFSIKFDDIGGLENIKDLIRGIVVLPIQRPNLFCKGQLRKPCKGILLFGPPGTGKTMLAKAVATEACATFFNISISSIVSNWFGDAENVVKAIFKLARKLAPSILFIDEVDAIFGKRTMLEHDKTRRTINEFMANWDSLLSDGTDRVLVLASTNRPFDLDDMAIRRFPRRFMVDLPDMTNRSKILEVILAKEDLSDDVDFNAIAHMTDLFSGGDLKNLCLTAANGPVRDFLKKDKGKLPVGTQPELRPLNMQDFKDARDKMRVRVSSRSSIVAEVRLWNELHGECYMTPVPAPIPSYFI